jgi:ChrR Cupin-like domain
MPKPALEFFPAASVEWVAVSPGVWERVLARDDDGVGLTRVLRWDPGLDTSPLGPAVHDYVEEVLILSGSMRDLTLDATFAAGDFACRPPGMVHGPWVGAEGCEMFEVRYTASSSDSSPSTSSTVL